MPEYDSSLGFLSMKRLESGPWQAFERSIARYFSSIGWPFVDLMGGVGDQGADIIISSEDREMVVQSKFRSGIRVGKGIVRDVKRAMDFYEIGEGIAVTNVKLSPLANEYLENLWETGYKIYKLEGKRLYELYKEMPRWPKQEYTPREYQVRALHSIWDSYQRGSGRKLLTLASGLGKTFVAGMFFKRVINEDPKKRIIVLANQEPLLKQFEEAVWKHLPKEISTHLWYGKEKPTYYDGITIATFQTLKNALGSDFDLETFDVVVADEAHHASAHTYRRVIEEINPSFLLGLTATPWRGDKRTLHDLFGPPTPECTVDIIEALRKGYLSRVDYRLFCDNLDWEFVHSRSRKKYTIKDLNRRLFIEERDDAILKRVDKVWDEIAPRRTIFYCASIDHAKRMEELLRERGYATRCLQTYEDTRENERRLRAFRRGDITALTAVNMLNEGVDVPEVELVVFLRVTHSRRIFLQQLGRGLRLSPDKEKVVVMDFVADIKRIAETMDIRNDLSRKAKDPEILKLRFDVKFSGNKAQSFFEEYLRDKAEIKTLDENERLHFP